MRGNQQVETVGIVVFPVSPTGHRNLPNFIATLEPLVAHICVVGGTHLANRFDPSKVEVVPVKGRHPRSFVARVLSYILTQLEVAFRVMKNLKHVDMLFFHIGGSPLVLPMISAKLYRKRVAIVVVGSVADQAAAIHPRLPYSKILSVLERINYWLCDLIVTLSGDLKQYPQFRHYGHKVCSAGAVFVNTSIFYIQKPFNARKQVIAYLGRFSREKGVLQLPPAIKSLCKQGGFEFLLIGDGLLRQEVSSQLAAEQATGEVKLIAGLSNHEVSAWLNQARLLVVPSYTEGLPNVILEAMACGTPVLATRVGSISSVVKDGETGFIMEDNNPECIASNIIRALNHPNLNQIVDNAHSLIERKYTLQAAVERYKTILSNLDLMAEKKEFNRKASTRASSIRRNL